MDAHHREFKNQYAGEAVFFFSPNNKSAVFCWLFTFRAVRLLRQRSQMGQ